MVTQREIAAMPDGLLMIGVRALLCDMRYKITTQAQDTPDLLMEAARVICQELDRRGVPSINGGVFDQASNATYEEALAAVLEGNAAIKQWRTESVQQN